MVKPYAVTLMVILEAATLCSQQPVPYVEFFTFFQKAPKRVPYQVGGRKYMTASVLLPPKTPGDNRLVELSFLYEPGNLNQIYFIACEGSVETSKVPSTRGPLGADFTRAKCFIDGSGYGDFDERVDAVYNIDTRRSNVAGQLDSFHGFSKIPPEEQEAATNEQRGWLEKMMSNYR